MSGKATFSERDEEVRNQMNEEGIDMDIVGAEDIWENGVNALRTTRGDSGGEVVLPNERLAVIWKRIFRVQFLDGAWRSQDETGALRHPKAYSNAKIRVDKSLSTPTFRCSTTHEKIRSPLKHFDPVPKYYGSMIYAVRILTGNDDYGMEELKDDLKLIEKMEYYLGDRENCSRCNPEIY